MPISFYIKSDQDYLSARLWVPQKSCDEGLVFCHGWGGGAQYDDLLQFLAESGYYALRLEQRGYGTSTGRADLSLWASDMAVCGTALRGLVPKIWAAGQSTGGAMALIAAATQDCFIGAVAIAPFCSLERIVQDNIDARPILEDKFGPLDDKHFKAADTLGIVDGLQKPVLLIHGTEDQTVPFEHGRILHKCLENVACFVPVHGGDHHLKNIDRSAVMTQLLTWLKGSRGWVVD